MLFGLIQSKLHAQCSANVPSFIVDLSDDPNAVWISPNINRDGVCCGASNPDKCIEFAINLHPDAQGIIFNLYSGAIPPGALFYQVGCAPPVMVGEPLCLNGAGPHVITFCKPGNNNNEYSITSVPSPGVGPNIAINDGCNGSVYAFGYDPSSIMWTSINPGTEGMFDDYLDCRTGCDSVNITAQPGFPSFADFQVCGSPIGGCGNTLICDTVRVTFNSTLIANITPTNPTVCFGAAGTLITANGNGGTPPYFYNWSTGDTTESIFIDVGEYYVTLSDSSGCPPTYDSVLVTTFANPIEANAGEDRMVCEDKVPINLEGSVVSASGGYWSGGEGIYTPNNTSLNTEYTPSQTEINNGVLQLMLITTGNQSCPADTDNIILAINKFNTTVLTFPKDVSCNGNNDGECVISLSGGALPHSITWNTSPVQFGNTATNLTAGTYQASIVDGNGCDTTISIIIKEPQPLVPLIIDSVNVPCFGGNSGLATASVAGGTAPYTYLWDTNAGNQSNATAEDLIAGTYSVIVTDDKSCTSEVSVTITQPDSVINISITTTDVTCFGFDNGSATAIPKGGTPPYTFQWFPTNQTTSIANNLPPGSYSVMVSDANECTLLPEITISEPQKLLSTITSTPVNCFGGNDGTAAINVMGGIPPYNYLWDSNTGNQVTSIATELSTDNYEVVVTDSNNCSDTGLIFINQPLEPLDILESAIDVSCNGGNNGSATIIISGGTSPYFTQWDANTGNQVGPTANTLTSGTYTAIVTDTNLCTDSANVIISQPPDRLSSVTSSNATNCFGENNGTATVITTGGTQPYSYLWDVNAENQVTSTASELTSGSYTVIITDTNNCLDTASITVTQPSMITVTASNDDTICPGENITIEAIASGGNGGYTYSWNEELSDDEFVTVNPLTTTTYILSVQDTLGCTGNIDSTIIYVPNFDPDSINIVSNGDICFGDTTQILGSYNAQHDNYDFSWNHGLGSGLGPFNVSPVSSTTYIFTVTDQCNNFISDSVKITPFPFPTINLQPIIAEGCEPLLVSFSNLTNDSTIVTYQWDFGDGFTSELAAINHLYQTPGTYNVNLAITSNNGCTTYSSGNNLVKVNPLPIANSTASMFVTDTQEPTIDFTNLSIGDTSVVWYFDDNDTSSLNNPSYTYQDTGTFLVTTIATNQYKCTDTNTLIIVVEPFYSFDIPNAFTPNPDGGNGGAYDPSSLLNNIFYPTTEFVKKYKMQIFNRWGELIFETNNINIGWDGYYKGVLAQQDVYIWKIEITYIDNKSFSKVGDITLIR